MNATRRHDLVALAILTSLITLLFADILLGFSHLYERDLLTYVYPGKKVLHDVVASGEFPYWNRAISGGQPMAANPAHEVFYPLTWLILLPDFDYGFQLFIVVHLYLAAWSMYALLRSLAISPAAAFFGALSFSLGGVVLSYVSLLPLLVSVVWLPVILLFVRRFVLHGAWRDFALASVFFAMQLLVGEPTTVLQTGLLAGMYAIYRGAQQGGARGIARALTAVALISVAAALVAAVAVMPAIDHARDSVRARGLPLQDVVDWSMPPARIGELLHATLLGHNAPAGQRLYWGAGLYARRYPFLFSIYPGLLVMVLATSGAIARVRGTALALPVIASSLFLAIGDSTPLWRTMYELGVVRSIRYPEKFILMAVVAMVLLAAKTLDSMLSGDVRLQRISARSAGTVAALAAVGAVVVLTPLHPHLFAATWNPPATLFAPMLAAAAAGWLILLARTAILLVLMRAVNRARRAVWLALLGAFVLLDLGMLLPELVKREEPAYLRSAPAVLGNLPPNRGDFRVFHHAAWHKERPEVRPYYERDADLRWVNRNAAFPMIPNAHGVQLAMVADYDYTALLPTTDFLMAVTTQLPAVRRDWVQIAASMSNVWYRVVYADPVVAFATARNDRRLLQPVGLLRMEPTARYSFATHLATVRDASDFVTKLGTRSFPPGTAYIHSPAFRPSAGRVLRVEETANTARIDVETAGRAFLVMSVTPHKYWSITIDGREAPAVITNVGYQGVVVPAAGRHVVTMRYRNTLIAPSAAVSGAALLGLWLLAKRVRRHWSPGTRAITMRAL